MATFTTRLGLRKPDPTPVTGDTWSTATDLNANWDKIDAAIPPIICTSATRPSTGLFVGMLAFETDTLRMIMCDQVSPVRWRNFSIPVVTNFADITAPYFGFIVWYQPDGRLYFYNGASFDVLGPRYMAGAKGSTDTGFGTTEAILISTGFVATVGRRYKIWADFTYYQDAGSSPYAINVYQRLRIIAGGTPTASGGTRIRSKLINTPRDQLFLGEPGFLQGSWVAPSSGLHSVSLTFRTSASTVRISGGTESDYEIMVEDIT